MKSVLISIKPEWCEKIDSGEKTIELRKTRPNLPTPFKCYIYCTKPKMRLKYVFRPEDYPEEIRPDKTIFYKVADGIFPFCSALNGYGKVIGEFVCDNVLDVCISISNPKMVKKAYPFPRTGLTDLEILNYLGNGCHGYGWHISNLIIYDPPKELYEFHRPCVPNCNFSEECGGVQDGEHCLFSLNRAPQSWCYVDEIC